MATFTKNLLSGSTNGKQILISGTASGSANTIHTAVSGTSNLDEIFLYVYNSSTSAVELTVLWGGTTQPDNEIKVTVPPKAGRTLVCDGMLLQNSLVVKAFAGTTNVLVVDGFVNSIT